MGELMIEGQTNILPFKPGELNIDFFFSFPFKFWLRKQRHTHEK